MRIVIVVATLAILSLAARAAELPWSVAPGFKVEVVATGFTMPVNIAFVPEPGDAPSGPYFYVTELYGSIKVVTRDFTVRDYAVDLLDYVPTGVFPGSGEQGMTGILVDSATGDLFVSKLYDSPFEPGVHYPVVLRLHSDDGGMTAASASVDLDMFGEMQGEAHQISTLTFGPDGMLYVHMGDGFIQSTAQDLGSFRGKILRMNRDGAPVADNPFFFSPDGINATDYIYAYGLDGLPGEVSRDERDASGHPTVLSGDIGVPATTADTSYHVANVAAGDLGCRMGRGFPF